MLILKHLSFTGIKFSLKNSILVDVIESDAWINSHIFLHYKDKFAAFFAKIFVFVTSN